MKSINTSALALCVLTLVIVCGIALSTGFAWTKHDFRSKYTGYRCVPSDTVFETNDTDAVTCGKICHLRDQCRSIFYQPDNRQCIGCRVYFYNVSWINRYEELPGSSHFSDMKQNLMTDCNDVLEKYPSATSGLYEITIVDNLWRVYCDMTTDGGGWTVFQNRFDGSVDFYRNFSEYENGFGDIYGEFWLGLRYIQALADKYPSEIRLVATEANGGTAYENYKDFRLLGGTNYTLSVGRLTNMLESQAYKFFNFTNGSPFSAFDRDMDSGNGNCAVNWHGAWWFDACSSVHFNGEYCTPGKVCTGKAVINGILHLAIANEESLKSTRMMIRPQM